MYLLLEKRFIYINLLLHPLLLSLLVLQGLRTVNYVGALKRSAEVLEKGLDGRGMVKTMQHLQSPCWFRSSYASDYTVFVVIERCDFVCLLVMDGLLSPSTCCTWPVVDSLDYLESGSECLLCLFRLKDEDG
jgi:hypothetical protein